MSELRNTTTRSGASAPAGWYADPHGLPQQRWWTGEQWTHAVAPAKQDPTRAPQVTAQAAPRETFALPATATPQDAFPTRRQLREQAAREAALIEEPHPAAPFVMPAAPAAAVPIPAVTTQMPTPVAALQPTIVPQETYTPQPAPLAQSFPPPSPSQQVFVPPPASAVAPAVAAVPPQPAAFAAPQPAAFAAPQPAAFAAPQSTAFSTAQPTQSYVGLASPSLMQPVGETAPVEQSPQASALAPAPKPLALAATVSDSTPASSWPFQTPPGSGFERDTDMPYKPFGMKQSVTAGIAAAPDRVQTWEVWAIALLPLVMGGVGVLVVTQLGEFYTTFMQVGLLFIFALITIFLAVRDRRALVDFGHSRTAHPAWVLLTPLAYLLARSARARGSAGRESAPLLVWLLVVAALTGLAFAFPEWLERLVVTTALF